MGEHPGHVCQRLSLVVRVGDGAGDLLGVGGNLTMVVGLSMSETEGHFLRNAGTGPSHHNTGRFPNQPKAPQPDRAKRPPTNLRTITPVYAAGVRPRIAETTTPDPQPSEGATSATTLRSQSSLMCYLAAALVAP